MAQAAQATAFEQRKLHIPNLNATPWRFMNSEAALTLTGYQANVGARSFTALVRKGGITSSSIKEDPPASLTDAMPVAKLRRSAITT
jgi:hypothetical protein